MSPAAEKGVHVRGFSGWGRRGMTAAVAVLAFASGMTQASDDDLELSGILINETRTFAGHDFFTEFSTDWSNYDTAGQYTLSIVERPSVVQASQITIKFAGRPVYQRFISPKHDENVKMARQAVQIVSREVGVMRTDVQSVMDTLFPDPDMAPDEIRLY